MIKIIVKHIGAPDSSGVIIKGFMPAARQVSDKLKS